MTLIKKIQIKAISMLAKALCIFPVDSKKIVFSSFLGNYYNDAPRFISEALDGRDDIKKIWILKKGVQHPKDVKTVRPKSLAALYALETSKIWVDNSRKSIWVNKRKKQVYFQTWHGSVALKKVEADAKDLLPAIYVLSAKHDSEMIDYFVSESKWRTKNIREAFWYSGKIIEGSIARGKNIITNRKEEVFSSFGIPEDAKVVLYAPTFRIDRRLDCYNIDYTRLRENLANRFSGNWYIIVRLHPNIAELNDHIEYSERILNGTMYPQMQNLLSSCDVLITDFSGCMFDGVRYGKKVFLYASDYQKYVKEERGLYFDLNDFPCPVCLDNDMLEKAVLEFDDKKYEASRIEFVNQLGFFENDASKEIIDIINRNL